MRMQTMPAEALGGSASTAGRRRSVPAVPIVSLAPIRASAPVLPWQPGWATALGPLLGSALAPEPDPSAGHYLVALDGLAGRPDEAVSLALKLPFCATRCWCCEREVAIAQPAAAIDDYLDGLIDEIGLVAARIGSRRDVLQLQLGGGSATELGSSQLVRLMAALQAAFRLPADAEMSADCDPRRVHRGQLELLRALGFRQIALGVLDLDADVQRAIGRGHSVALIDDVCEQARASGIECIDLRLMLGLPQQTETRWRTTLARVLALAPDRVSLAHYRHQPWCAPAQYAIDAGALPDGEQCSALAALTADLLREAGYRWIGADRFVLESDPLWRALEQGRLRCSLISHTATPPTATIGLGVGAVGEIDGSVFWNESASPRWREALRAGRLPVAQAQRASLRETQRRRAVEHLLCGLELPASLLQGGLEAAYGRLARHEAAGLVRRLEDRLVVTDSGRHALAMLCSELHEPDEVDGADSHDGLRP